MIRIPSRRARPEGGFTAVETLAVLALLGMMMLMSIPALMDFFRAIRVRAAAERLVSQLRLCRQVAVTRRARVLFEFQGKDSTSTYKAWEDLDLDHVKDDEEPWVVREDVQLTQDRVHLSDAYNDTSPGTAHDETITSALQADKILLRFDPNGQVLRLNPANSYNAWPDDTLIRLRLRGLVNSKRCDEWEVGLNRPGKIESDWKRIQESDGEEIPDDCTL